MLGRFHAGTGGESLRVNVALVLRNAALAARDRARGVSRRARGGRARRRHARRLRAAGRAARAGSDTPAVVAARPAAGAPTRRRGWPGWGCRSSSSGASATTRPAARPPAPLRRGGGRRPARRAPRASRPGPASCSSTPTGERTMLTDPGANARLDAGDLPGDLIRPGGHLHVSGYALLRPGSRPRRRGRPGRRPRRGGDHLGRPGVRRPARRGGRRDAFLRMARVPGRSSRPATRPRCSPAPASPGRRAPSCCRAATRSS